MTETMRIKHLTFAALVALVATSAPSSAEAKKGTKYVYVVSKVEAAKGVAAAPIEQVRSGLDKGMAKSDEITGQLPDGAPDPKAEPKKFKKFLKKKRLRAFKVNVEIIAYEKSVETKERGFKRVGVHISLRLFGETIPDRVMAFAGAGSATVKLDVGKKVRPADEKAANREAIEVAIEDAIATSLKKLAEPKRKKKKRKKRAKK